MHFKSKSKLQCKLKKTDNNAVLAQPLVHTAKTNLLKHKDEEKRNRPSCCVFVASLSLELSDQTLLATVTKHFSSYGKIKLTKVLRDSSKRPYAFVQYFNKDDAKRALKNAVGTLLNNRPIRIEMAKVNRTLLIQEIYLLEENNPDLSVFTFFSGIGELEQLTRQTDYIQLLNSKTISNPTIPKFAENKDTFDFLENLQKRSWIVQFAFREDAIKADAFCKNNTRYKTEWIANIDTDGIEKLNLVSRFSKFTKHNTDRVMHYEQSFNDQCLRTRDSSSYNNYNIENFDFVSFSNNDNYSQTVDIHSIFIGQLTVYCTEQALYQKFKKHGYIENIKLFNKNPQNCYAFITFKNSESAASAVEAENHTAMDYKSIHVKYRELNHLNAKNKRNANYKNDSKPKYSAGNKFEFQKHDSSSLSSNTGCFVDRNTHRSFLKNENTEHKIRNMPPKINSAKRLETLNHNYNYLTNLEHEKDINSFEDNFDGLLFKAASIGYRNQAPSTRYSDVDTFYDLNITENTF